MNLPYIKVFPDLCETVSLLSDAEAGRLLKSVLRYANGEEAELPGQEKLVFAMLRRQMDRDAAEYARNAEKQRRNGQKGGRPKKATGTHQNPKNPLVFFESQKSKEKEEEKDKEEVERACAREAAAASGSTGGQACVQACAPLMTDAEMDAASEAFARIMEAMEAVGIKATAYNCDQVMAMQAEYGMDRVLDAIHRAAEGDRKGGISLAFLRAILAREQGGGTPDADEAEARRARDEARTLARLRGELPK